VITKILIRICYFLIGTILGLIVVSSLSGCGGHSGMVINQCTDIFTQEFCDGVGAVDGRDGTNGQDGIDGQDGVDGVDGDPGNPGRDGIDGTDGVDGQDGSSCSVRKTVEGAIIQCEDGTSAVIWNGTNGHNGADAILEVVDLCKNADRYGEVLFRLSDKELYGVYSDKDKVHMVRVSAGTWITTDGFSCKFQVTEGGEVLY
jgi:hypothetical protein